MEVSWRIAELCVMSWLTQGARATLSAEKYCLFCRITRQGGAQAGGREPEAKNDARRTRAFEIGLAAVRLRDGLHDRQAEPGAALVGASRDEAAEESVLHVALDAAGALHGEHDVFGVAHDLDLHGRRGRGVHQ